MTIPMFEGARYTRPTLLSDTPYRLKGKTHLHYRCICDCGISLLVAGHRLRNGSVMSCGCLQKESQQKNFKLGRKGYVPSKLTIYDTVHY